MNYKGTILEKYFKFCLIQFSEVSYIESKEDSDQRE